MPTKIELRELSKNLQDKSAQTIRDIYLQAYKGSYSLLDVMYDTKLGDEKCKNYIKKIKEEFPDINISLGEFYESSTYVLFSFSWGE